MTATTSHVYDFFRLFKDGKSYERFQHRLLAEAFIPNPDNKVQVDHINRDKKNNSITNLRWATCSENQINKGAMKNNVLGEKNIMKVKNRYIVRIMRNKKIITDKSFKTLEEAREHRDEFVESLST